MSKKQDDASRVAGLASILASSNKPKDPPPSPAPLSPASPVIPAASAGGKIGRGGKRADPSYDQYGLYLRKDTHKRARRKLEDLESGKDMSDLVQELLEQWLKSG